MSNTSRLCRLLALSLLLRVSAATAPGPGEFEIPATLPLNAAQRMSLRSLVSEDPEAAVLYKGLTADAQALLAAQPHPLAEIHYEGLVHTDPRRIATVSKLRGMSDVATVLLYWQASADPAAAAMLRRFILAWADTYVPTGNDVNENKLYPLFVAYEALREEMPAGERARVDAWILRLGEKTAASIRRATSFTNRYTKHLRLAAVFGRILDRADWRDLAESGLKRFVSHSLRADGGSADLEHRDSLTYHASALRPLLELALLAGERRNELYTWTGERGGSIQRSVDLVLPYATGGKTREEWRNSKVALDRRRAEAGLEGYQPGSLYDPRSAIPLLEEASAFEPTLVPLLLRLHGSEARRFASWRMVVNAALLP